MSDQIPKTMRAVVQKQDEKWVEVKEVPVPTLEKNEVLVEIEYAAQNPTDWKHATGISPPGVQNGCDFAGTVVSLGSELDVPLKVGDKVAGCTHGGIYKDRGAYAEYARIDSDMCFKVPEGMKLEEASTFGVAWVTACQALIDSQKKQFPTQDKVPKGTWYVIYGASSSVGLFAVLLAKAMGYKIIGVASPHSFDLVKSYGADEVLDYHDGDKAIADALKLTDGEGVEYALDTISEGDSWRITLGMMGKKGKQLNGILPVTDEAKKLNPKIEIVFTVMYTLFGKEFKFGPNTVPASEHDHEFGKAIFANTAELITKHGIKANPVSIRGGLDDVSDGFKEMQAGKVSGKKLVYKIA
ncbi:hypothetical protein CI109_100284 [Kwoniella shandongensis]|uniref:Uncharacterized protein n=1 Tax=Kwoniella shandongensis TaxID=1734106 RepID=A0A5M6C585_9TREE|nr:uncharacterized protein CI109_001871 [Kwoniella shandongensis]KAA5529931.1 hypothetical protein CI109_001871 [Kwoniella shandongensis]